MSLREAAALFGVKVDRLRKAAWEGRLQVRLVGTQRLVLPSEVERFLRAGSHSRALAGQVAAQGGDSMARIIAVAIPKGGTGKTTTVLNLGTALAEAGKRVLLVDSDPQASLTIALGFDVSALEHTLYSSLKYYLTTFHSQIELAIQQTAIGVDLIPSSIRLNRAQEELSATVQREFVLQRLLDPVASHYDVILIDTLPYLGILVINALVAAHEVLIPMEPEYLATESVAMMLEDIEFMHRSGLNPHLSVTGILLTQVDTRTVIHRQVASYMRTEFGSRAPVFQTMIKQSIRFPESQACHQPILHYDPVGEGAMAYRALARELLDATA
jgi:chromosome partitioning protein